jgi:dihydroorotate dehydrogenase
MDVYGWLRPALFRLPADRAHDLAHLALRLPLPFRLLGPSARAGDRRLATDLAGIPLANPVGLAPGFDKNGDLLPSLQHLGFGYVVIGSLTPEPRAGNPRPRLVRYPDRLSIANSMGLPNQGVEAAVRRLRSRPITHTAVIASVAGFSPESILAGVAALEPYVAAVEVGLICPNTSESERMREIELVGDLVAELGRRRTRPTFVKLPPYHSPEDRTRVLAMADLCIGAGIDGVSLNGGRHVVEPRLSVGHGSLAGRETFPDALRIVGEVADHAAGRLAIRASGGVFTGDDAAAMLRAGAVTVEVYSSFVYRGWRVAEQINRRLLDILTRESGGSVEQLTKRS